MQEQIPEKMKKDGWDSYADAVLALEGHKGLSSLVTKEGRVGEHLRGVWWVW